jgi:hypothetical protein
MSIDDELSGVPQEQIFICDSEPEIFLVRLADKLFLDSKAEK